MLADRRYKALVENFVWQWLNLSKLRGVTPDPDVFPGFDENLRLACVRAGNQAVLSQANSMQIAAFSIYSVRTTPFSTKGWPGITRIA